jgi:PAS domain S-box-containing protein
MHIRSASEGVGAAQNAQTRLEETEEIIRAISVGEVDAFVIGASDDPQVVTLSTADRAYRLLTDKMVQGAVMVSPDSTIMYANAPFARLLGVELDTLVGTRLTRLVHDGDRPLIDALLSHDPTQSVDGEIIFKAAGGDLPVRIESGRPFEDGRAVCLIVTDLSERRRHEAIAEAEALSRSILDQAVDAVVVCDMRGDVIRASKSAHALCGRNPLLKPFLSVFPLTAGPERLDFTAILQGRVLRNVTFEMACPDRRLAMAVSAGPVVDPSGETVAAVITMTDITDIKRAAEELEQADARKDEMLAVVVHELRDPLAAIHGAVHVFEHEPVTAPAGARVRQALRRGVDQITRLVEDLSDLNRIRLHKLSIDCHPVDVRSIVERAFESRQPMMAGHAHQVELVLPRTPVPVSADETRLTQVFVNLINNAIKFTPDRGSIRLRVDVDEAGGTGIVTVRDTGVGIAQDLLPKIFNAFEQGAQSHTYGGLGIGLTLSRRIAELHGGTIEAASAGPGAGSVFTVRLPLLSNALSRSAGE